MGKFNRKLSQLEAIYQIADPVLKAEDPVVISTFIKNVFEHSEDYGLNQLNNDWFNRFASIDKKHASTLVHNLLQQNNQLISKKSILEGIELYQTEISNGKA